MKTSTIITENNMEYLIVHTTNKKKGTETESRYCLETNTEIWKPTYPGEICPEYMLRYCKAKGLADLEWYVKILDEQIEKTLPSKISDVVKTVKRKRTPSEVRQEFIKKYFPDMKRVKDWDRLKTEIEEMKQVLEAEGWTLKVVEYSDYVVPNNVVEDGEMDANYFQHLPYLDDFNAENGTKLVSISTIHVEPLGLYGGKQTTLDALK